MKGNLLIVDDEPLLLENLKILLMDTADNIFLANNGIEALKILDSNTINCVLCDINMPKMNGVELIKKIRETNHELPFIFYTGHGNDALMMESVKYGAFDFLDKPSLEGVEEVVTRGLKEGIGQKNTEKTDKDAFISEYQKMLEQINKK